MAHLVTKAMAWCDAPFKLHTHPPSTTHLRAYVAGRNAHPSGIQSLMPEGKEVPSHPLVTPLMRGPHTNTTWTLVMPNYGS